MIISVDTETTGLDPDTCQLLEIGVVTADQKLRIAIPHREYRGQAFALSMHPGLLRLLADHSCLVGTDRRISLEDGTIVCDIRTAGSVWYEFMDSLGKPKLFIGKNLAGFDAPFLRQAGIKLPHRVLDLGTLVWQKFNLTEIPNLQECMKLLEYPGSVRHTALDDAQDVYNMAVKMGHL